MFCNACGPISCLATFVHLSVPRSPAPPTHLQPGDQLQLPAQQPQPQSVRTMIVGTTRIGWPASPASAFAATSSSTLPPPLPLPLPTMTPPPPLSSTGIAAVIASTGVPTESMALSADFTPDSSHATTLPAVAATPMTLMNLQSVDRDTPHAPDRSNMDTKADVVDYEYACRPYHHLLQQHNVPGVDCSFANDVARGYVQEKHLNLLQIWQESKGPNTHSVHEDKEEEEVSKEIQEGVWHVAYCVGLPDRGSTLAVATHHEPLHLLGPSSPPSTYSAPSSSSSSSTSFSSYAMLTAVLHGDGSVSVLALPLIAPHRTNTPPHTIRHPSKDYATPSKPTASNALLDGGMDEDTEELDIPVIDVNEVLVCRLTALPLESHGHHNNGNHQLQHNSRDKEEEEGDGAGYASLSLTSVAWDPLQPGRLATGCSDGVVLLWDIGAHLQRQVQSGEREADKKER